VVLVCRDDGDDDDDDDDEEDYFRKLISTIMDYHYNFIP
jgi:hypothetical protein